MPIIISRLAFLSMLHAALLLVACKDQKVRIDNDGSTSVEYAAGGQALAYQNVQVDDVKRVLSIPDYFKWVQDNLRVGKQIGAIQYELLYQPEAYSMLKDRQTEVNAHEEAIGEGEEDPYQYFVLTITDLEGRDLLKSSTASSLDYQERLRYYSFEMDKDIKLLEGADTLSCRLYHFERTYGIAPYLKIVLAFDKGQSTNADKIFVLHDQLSGNGLVKLKFPGNLISRIPDPAL